MFGFCFLADKCIVRISFIQRIFLKVFLPKMERKSAYFYLTGTKTAISSVWDSVFLLAQHLNKCCRPQAHSGSDDGQNFN